jgi:DivIVA domain-containing protein
MAADPHTDETAPETAPQRFQRAASASELLREASFPMVMRGYDRHAVDQLLSELLALVDELESRQTREGVVQKALDQIGEETAGILQHAHETADEITSRSRAQADARLSRAEREAEILRRDADEYAEHVITDTRTLWEERQRLIEDIRQLADDVLGTADDALERLKLPEALGAGEAAHGLEPAEEPYDEEPAATEPFERDPDPTEPFERDPDATEVLGAQPPLGIPEEAEPGDVNVSGRPPEAEAREESGHTVELEALPGGVEEPIDRD